jgi:hypothetical protein
MKKTLAAAALAASLALTAAPAFAGTISHFSQQATQGFYRGKAIEYLDFGPVKLAAGNREAPIWSVTNGANGQVNIVDVVPGQQGYTPLWDVRLVTWKAGVTPRLLTSAAAVRKAVAGGEATVKDAGVVVNCPVI